MFLLFSSFIMFRYEMELFGLICSFMIFISYSLATTSFNSSEKDEKLLTLAKMGGDLTVFFHPYVVVCEVFLMSLEKVNCRHESAWIISIHSFFWLFTIIDISRLFRFFFLPLISFWGIHVCLL